MKHEFKSRGHRWRVQSDPRGRFDEIAVVIGREPKVKDPGGLVLHAEMCDNRSGYVDVCGVQLWFFVGRDGVARITMSEDHREGAKALDLRDPALDARPKPRKRI